MEGLALAFDFGLKHIGVAVGQIVTKTASPLTTLRATDGAPDWEAVASLVQEWQPTVLLVGLPLNMDDSESEMSARARGFGARLQRRFSTEVIMVDERLTSVAASELSATRSHEVAAVLIAESWLSGL